MPMYDFRCERCDAMREQTVPSDVRKVQLPCVQTHGMCEFIRQFPTPAVQVAMKDRAVCPPLRRYDGTE